MTLRQTELIGKKLVKYGFYRSRVNHHQYTYVSKDINVSVEFKLYFSHVWVANFTHDLEFHTRVNFVEHTDVFTPEWLIEEHNKLRAVFNFLRV
jgi:hypothetical protein